MVESRRHHYVVNTIIGAIDIQENLTRVYRIITLITTISYRLSLNLAETLDGHMWPMLDPPKLKGVE